MPASSTTAVWSERSNDAYVLGLLAGTEWSGAMRYSFTASPGNYETNYVAAPALGSMFAELNYTQKTAVRNILGNGLEAPSGTAPGYGSVSSLIATSIVEVANPAGVNSAEIRIANSGFSSTAYAYYPATDPVGGDVWLGYYAAGDNNLGIQNPQLGSFGYLAILHELGHALGLKHPHEMGQTAQFPAMPQGGDTLEFTVMSYRSSLVSDYTGGYTNETWGYPQTLMMYDIAALQFMYGADYTTNSGDTVYAWRPDLGAMSVNGAVQAAPAANRIFLTIWDGGGIDTYDLSRYVTGVAVDLNPGASSRFSQEQLVRLTETGTTPGGNVYNALLSNNDPRSYIENAIGGASSDSLRGNRIANALNGNAGNDEIHGNEGGDSLVGGAGDDWLYGGSDNDRLVGDTGNDLLWGGSGRDTLTGGAGNDIFAFALPDSAPGLSQRDLVSDFTPGRDLLDLSQLGQLRFLGTAGRDGLPLALRYQYDAGRNVTSVEVYRDGDQQIDFAFDISGNKALAAPDFTSATTVASPFRAPTAVNDAYVILQGQSLTVGAASGVLKNDAGVSALSAADITDAQHGSLVVASDGGLVYTPAAGFHGIDNVTYRVTTGDGAFAQATASIFVAPVWGGATHTLDLGALSPQEQVAATYVSFFGRGADEAGFDFWVGEFGQALALPGGIAPFVGIASSFGISAEARGLYPFLANPAGASDGQVGAFLGSVYDNLFNRSPDGGGISYWTGQIKQTLARGEFVGSVLVNIMSGAQGPDITTLMSKVAVNMAFVAEQDEHDMAWAGASDVIAATHLLDPVGSDPQSVLIGIKNADALVAAHL